MNIKFNLAPRDKLAFWITLFYIGIIMYSTIAVVSASKRAGHIAVAILVPIIISVISLIIYAPGPSNYEIDAKGISIHRILGTIFIPHNIITGIEEVRSVRFKEHYGNGGLFSYYGTYLVTDGGKGEVYATRLDTLVKIATQEITYYISPDNAQMFVSIEQTYLSQN